MEPKSFNRDIKPLFAKYIDGMKDVQLSTGGGTTTLYLGTYADVKAFYWQIQVAIHGYDKDVPNLSEQQRLHDRNDPTRIIDSAPHPMPPDGRLPQAAIDLFDQWVRDGMLA